MIRSRYLPAAVALAACVAAALAAHALGASVWLVVSGALAALALCLALGWRAGPTARPASELRSWAALFTAATSPNAIETPGWLRPLAATLAPAWEAMRQQLCRREQEAGQLRHILASLDTAAIGLDGERRLFYINPAGEQLLGAGGRAAVGERLPALARIPQIGRWLVEIAADRQPRLGRVETADGRTLQVELVALDDPYGGVALLARDASELARLEILRRDFIAAVSHELRTPATSTRGYAEILLQDEALPPEQRRQFLATIVANAHRLDKLAQDLVTLSAIETGHYPFHFRRLDAASLLGPALSVLRPLAAERDCTLQLAASQSAWVRADAEALHRALLNLIENAILHGGRGTSVALSGVVAAASGERAYRIEVADTGAGISSSDQPRVFERFYRADSSHSRAAGGSGLGLALVKHIVQEHGGRVELRSRLGAGSSFAIVLPLAAEEQAAAPGNATSAAREDRAHG